ncbi:2Fe-2S iron-sulfur cluster-binding protein [Streptomyces cyaneus]|uniref:2Fe-2S iron-sulfur cluster-binding protein n=1 Tax=Streptomyces cyaneus TaxID=1904 RepID=UPI000FF8A741|nr:2Fe-2S iron-sulfur cluster-binding protein [Streptomyces cyaneus]
MTDDHHGEGTPQGRGRWDPLPQGDYDDGATAFVKLPEGGIDALLASTDSPLAAPGHGYVPPQITVAQGPPAGTDPAAPGGWPVAGTPVEGAQWPDPNAAPQDGGTDHFNYNPGATQQWNFSETAAGRDAAPAPGQDVTGQWSIPVAGGDLPDESGEFTTSSLVEQWGGTPPATLPGGAPAPWATQATGQPWGQQAQAAGATDEALGGAPATGELTGAGHAPGRPGQPGGHVGDHHAVHTTDRSGAHPTDQPGPDMHARVEPGSAEHASGDAGDDDLHALASEPPAETAPDASRGAPEPGEAAADAQGAPEAAEGPAEASAEPTAAEGGDSDQEGTEDPARTAASDDVPAPPGEEHPLASYVLRVNGVDRPVSDAWIGESLLYVLRERLGLAGAKDGCSQGECGACNVQVDGRLVASCLVPAVTAAGAEVRTVEGLAEDGQPSDVQRALARCGAVQCGFCVPGMAMTVHDLLEGNPAPTELEARQALCGNLCRCSGYRGVLDAVKEVVAEREAQAAADDGEQDGDEPRIPHQAGPGAGGVHPSAFEAPGAMNPGPGRPHDQAYGQDGGQA